MHFLTKFVRNGFVRQIINCTKTSLGVTQTLNPDEESNKEKLESLTKASTWVAPEEPNNDENEQFFDQTCVRTRFAGEKRQSVNTEVVGTPTRVSSLVLFARFIHPCRLEENTRRQRCVFCACVRACALMTMRGDN